jgi:SAM-dependent methyltransferase
MVLSPLTGKPNVRLVKKVDPRELVRQWCETFSIDVSHCFAGTNEIEHWQCNDSGLLFYMPLSIAGDASVYEGLRIFSRGSYYMEDKWEYRAAEQWLPGIGKVLEIGCGDGHFLERCARRGLAAVGLELAPPQSTRGNRPPMDIRNEMLNEHVANHANSYDAVCSFQVLEHVACPREYLENSIELLKPGGLMIIGTPNSESFLKYAYNLLDMPPHHMTGWSAPVYRFLERILPIKLQQLVYEPLAPHHCDYFVDTFRKRFQRAWDPRSLWTRGQLGRLSEKLLNSGVRKLVRGQSMLAVFRKIA